jgi:effector-binding domain-containing protein
MYQVSSRVFPEQPTLVMFAKVTVSEIPQFLGKAYGAVTSQVTRSGLTFVGPPFARCRALDDEYSEFEIEAGFPVDRQAHAAGEVEPSTLPAGLAAVVTHIGSYDQMMPAYEAIASWIAEHNGVVDGAPWEIYYTDPNEQPDPATWRTEIVQPYKTT